MFKGCRSRLQAKEDALAAAQLELQSREAMIHSMTHRFDQSLESLTQEECQLAEEQAKHEEDLKLHKAAEAESQAAISAGEQSAEALSNEVDSLSPCLPAYFSP